jgi:predicted esterase
MNGRLVFLRILVFFGLQTLCLAEEQGKLDLSFSASAPYSTAAAVSRHFSYTSAMPDYSVTNELFQVIVPASQSTNASWGLLVWISPSDEPRIPSDWDAELGKRQLIVVGAYRSGNGRQPIDRIRLALDATYNVCRRYKVNRDRIYVGGFSGGGRIASMLGVGYADIFRGTLAICGVNFYLPVSDGHGKNWPASYISEQGMILLAQKSGRFVLLTGEQDPNRENTRDLANNGFKLAGFKSVLYLEVPGMNHEIPGAPTLAVALDFLAGNQGLGKQPR